MDDVERVAKLLFNWDHPTQDPNAITSAGHQWWTAYERTARSIIAALRQPTPEPATVLGGRVPFNPAQYNQQQNSYPGTYLTNNQPASPPTRRTVKVRVAVAVTPEGDWNAAGSSAQEPDQMRDEAKFFEPNQQRFFWLTAELPIPEDVTVQATVEGGE